MHCIVLEFEWNDGEFHLWGRYSHPLWYELNGDGRLNQCERFEIHKTIVISLYSMIDSNLKMSHSGLPCVDLEGPSGPSFITFQSHITTEWSFHSHPWMDFNLSSSMEEEVGEEGKEEMDPDDWFSDIWPLSPSQMAFALQSSTERQTDDSSLFPIRRVTVGNGIAQFFRCSSPNVSAVRRIWIPRSVEAGTFADWRLRKSLSSITFESDSRLTRIESYAFSSSSLQSIVIPRNVEGPFD
jgi:hypothetical protein